MNAVGVHDNEVIVEGTLRIWAFLAKRMAQLDSQTEALQGCTFEIITIPFLCRLVRYCLV